MLIIQDPGLSEATVAHLTAVQAAIDRHLPDFEAAKAEMNRLWKDRSKDSGAAPFAEIESQLGRMAIGRKYCNYCEHNRISTNAIEHVRPKSTFPYHAFRWENMLRACPQCNMEEKLAKMKVFAPAGSAQAVSVGRSQPPTDDLCFINPRIEDALDLMELDFGTFLLFCSRGFPPDSREYAKVTATIEILNLNHDDLVSSRQSAFRDFKNCLAEYCDVLNAHDHQSLQAATHNIPQILSEQDFEPQKRRILDGLQATFSSKTHQTVWREMQRRQPELSLELQELFRKSGAAGWPVGRHTT